MAAEASLRGSERTSECVRVACVLLAIAARVAVHMGERATQQQPGHVPPSLARGPACRGGQGIGRIRNGIPTFSVGQIGMLCCKVSATLGMPACDSVLCHTATIIILPHYLLGFRQDEDLQLAFAVASWFLAVLWSPNHKVRQSCRCSVTFH
jgi:hypothetical protein